MNKNETPIISIPAEGWLYSLGGLGVREHKFNRPPEAVLSAWKSKVEQIVAEFNDANHYRYRRLLKFTNGQIPDQKEILKMAIGTFIAENKSHWPGDWPLYKKLISKKPQDLSNFGAPGREDTCLDEAVIASLLSNEYGLAGWIEGHYNTVNPERKTGVHYLFHLDDDSFLDPSLLSDSFGYAKDREEYGRLLKASLEKHSRSELIITSIRRSCANIWSKGL